MTEEVIGFREWKGTGRDTTVHRTLSRWVLFERQDMLYGHVINQHLVDTMEKQEMNYFYFIEPSLPVPVYTPLHQLLDATGSPIAPIN